MKKKLFVAGMMIFMLLSANVGYGSTAINWETLGGVTAYLWTDSGFTTKVTGHQTDPTIGGFIQLLYVGANGYEGLGDQGTTGVLGNDEVIATGHVGLGVGKPGNMNGTFIVTDSAHTKPTGSLFAIRFFSAPSANYGSGYIPASGNYGIANNGGGYYASTISEFDDFTISVNLWADTPVTVPEPCALLLGLVGMGVVALKRKRSKKA